MKQKIKNKISSLKYWKIKGGLTSYFNFGWDKHNISWDIERAGIHNHPPIYLGVLKQATFQPQPMWAIIINMVDME